MLEKCFKYARCIYIYIQSGPEFVVQAECDSMSKNKKKIGITFFYLELGLPENRLQSLFIFVNDLVVYSSTAVRLRLRQCLQALFIAWLKQYKVFLLIINFSFLITTFYCNTTIQCTVTNIVGNVLLGAAYISLLNELMTLKRECKLISFFLISRFPA